MSTPMSSRRTPGSTAGIELQPPVDPGVRRDDGQCVSLNGRVVHTAALTLHGLLVEHGYDLHGAFACAVNTAFVPRSQWAAQRLCEGDRIDVVAPITGG